MGELPEEIRCHQGDHSEANRDRDHEQVVAVGLEIDLDQNARAGCPHRAEHHEVVTAQRRRRRADPFADRIIGVREGRVCVDVPTADFDDKKVASIYGGSSRPERRACEARGLHNVR